MDSQEATWNLKKRRNEKTSLVSTSLETWLKKGKLRTQESEDLVLIFSDYQQSTDKISNSFNFETFKAEGEWAKVPPDFSDYDEEAQLNETLKKEQEYPLNFETFGDEENRGQRNNKVYSDFSGYNEETIWFEMRLKVLLEMTVITKRNKSIYGVSSFISISMIWRKQSVLEEMDVYIFNKPEQFSNPHSPR